MRFAPPRLLLAGLLLVPALAACGGSDSGGAVSDASKGHVNVIDNKFDPKTTTVAPGDTVTWDFKGSAQHNVTGQGLASGNKQSGSYTHTFNSAGTYSYVCTIHAGMAGKIVVK